MQNIDSTKYGLALHTSSPQLGLAISNFVDKNRCQTWDLGHGLSTHLHQYLADFLIPQTWKDLAFIAVAKGPGSFTATRIGVVTARTLAQQLDIPLLAISTLAAVAWSISPPNDRTTGGTEQEQAIALQMPAQRGQLFTAIYQISSNPSGLIQKQPDAVITSDTWKQTLDTLEMPYQLIDVPTDLGTTVSSLLELAYLDWQLGKHSHWSEALPFYGQHPVENTTVK
ncbi:MAG: tRNA (adenosine(37)-N6)-threonylcarbamoyltransferase complex dimerization subunit type 1 TsaB [Potamolinea sp.]